MEASTREARTSATVFPNQFQRHPTERNELAIQTLGCNP